MNRMNENAPRRRSELEALEKRFLKLPEVDQLDFAAWVADYLALERSLFSDEAAKRRETLDCIGRAAAHLGLGRPPKVEEYQQAARTLGLAWSWQKIHRLWGSFAVAAGVAFGACVPASAQQRSFISRYNARTRREEYFTAIRLWLATAPAANTMTNYDSFAREYNYTLPEDEMPLPRYATMVTELALTWRDILAIAAGELDHADAVRQRGERRDQTRGSDDLIGVGTLALMRGLSKVQASRLVEEADFPRPALVLANRRSWLRQEVEAYFEGARPALKEANWLRDRYLTSRQVTARLGVSQTTLLKERKQLSPCGMVGGVGYWLKSDVDAYIAARPGSVARREQARRRPGTVNALPRRTQFITKNGLARELGFSFEAVRTLTREPGFPQPVARFGKAGVWLREDVEAYLAGRPVQARAPTALQEKLVDAGALGDYLGYAPGTFTGRPAAKLELPRPVASPDSKSVWLKEEIDAWLEADPRRAELRERRLLRRRQSSPSASSASSQANVSSGVG